MDVNIADLEPKNVDLLRRYVTDQGRILPRKYLGSPPDISASSPAPSNARVKCC